MLITFSDSFWRCFKEDEGRFCDPFLMLRFWRFVQKWLKSSKKGYKSCTFLKICASFSFEKLQR